MEEQINLENESPKIINVFPINKGKRILLFLADFFICFLISLLAFNLAVFPIGYLATGYKNISENMNRAQQNINICLANNSLVYFEENDDRSDINKGMEYTFNLYIKDLLNNVKYDDVNSHDVFYKYYQDNNERYFDLYIQFDKKTNYFNIDKNNQTIQIKDEYIEQLSPLLVSLDSLSDDGLNIYNNMFNKFFLTYYSQMLADIGNTDLIYNSISYIDNHNVILNGNKIMDNLIIISSIISYFISIVICYILIPCINRYHKTIASMIMKINLINIHSMKILNKKQTAGFSIYRFFTNLAFIIFIPLFIINIEYIFNLMFTLYLSIASIIIILISLIFLLFNKSNQTLCDYVYQVAYISDDSLDEIFKARGYYI